MMCPYPSPERSSARVGEDDKSIGPYDRAVLEERRRLLSDRANGGDMSKALCSLVHSSVSEMFVFVEGRL